MSKRVLAVDAELPGFDVVRLRSAILAFRGDARILESAVGMWALGSLIGGRGLELVHTRIALEKYSRALGFSAWAELRAQLPDSGPKTKDLGLLKLRRRFDAVVNALVSASHAGTSLPRAAR